MKSTRFLSLLSVGALAATLGSSAIAAAFPGQQLSSQAKVTIAQARATALRTAKGTIESEELERERGGSGLRYTFDIKTRAGVREVGVDAKTGAVIENSAEATTRANGNADNDGETGD